MIMICLLGSHKGGLRSNAKKQENQIGIEFYQFKLTIIWRYSYPPVVYCPQTKVHGFDSQRGVKIFNFLSVLPAFLINLSLIIKYWMSSAYSLMFSPDPFLSFTNHGIIKVRVLSEKKFALLFGCDANVHSTTWRNNDTNHRGE